MIEGNFTEAGPAALAKGGGLQPLEWTVLSAKLAAAHDLRGALKGSIGEAAGNFARFSSGVQMANGATLNETMLSVNLEASADDKRSRSKAVATEIDAVSVSKTNMAPSDREL